MRHPHILEIRGLAEGAVAQIAGNDASATGAGHVGILDTEVTHAAAEHAEDTGIVIRAGQVVGQVLDDMILSVEVEIGIAAAIVEQRCPVRHAGHVNVGLQNNVVHLARLHKLD